ncbi:Flp pilus assembly protein CpaB [Sphingopyxis sp. P8]|uniref:Flp pilus assembly protein CpaB n=1 Tax=Sphingopyxis sp. P8 TaxID=2763256 RepID=UPI001D0BAB2F|nr:Flp pilus assembly protein CpaB [Sphingopyxis sp. P8]
MLSNRTPIIVSVAVVLGLIVVFLVNSYFSGIEERQQRQAEELNLVQVLVASQPLAFGTTLTPQNTKLVGWPASSVPEGAFKTSIGVTDNARGPRVALRPIAVGEPILASKISGDDGRASISALLPEGMRAAAVRIDDVAGVGGMIAPGDIVDVLLTRQLAGEGVGNNDQMTDIILEKIRVIAIDQVADENKTEPAVAKTATLEVDPVGAQKLALAQRVGALSLALRNVTSIEDGANMTITQSDLGGGWRSAPARRAAASPGLAGMPPGFYSETPAVMQRAPSGPVPAAPRRPTGPSVEIVRGTETQTYEVKRHGS